MPDFVPILGDIEVRITGQHTGGKKEYNVLHFDCASPLPTLSEVTDCTDAVAAWCIGFYKDCFSSTFRINEVRGRSNAEEPGPTYTNNTISQPGELVGDQLSMDTTMCVNLLSGLTGGSNRGKFFVFTATETEMLGGIFTVAYQTICESSMVELVAALDISGFALAIESRRRLRLRQVVAFLGQIIPSHLQSRKVNHGI